MNEIFKKCPTCEHDRMTEDEQIDVYEMLKEAMRDDAPFIFMTINKQGKFKGFAQGCSRRLYSLFAVGMSTLRIQSGELFFTVVDKALRLLKRYI